MTLHRLQNPMDDLERLQRLRAADAVRRAIECLGDAGLEVPSFAEEVHAIHRSWLLRRSKDVAAETISPAAAAAFAPPYPAFSRMTANAMRLVAGPYGANPANQACDGAPATWAVPVLPAIRPGCARN